VEGGEGWLWDRARKKDLRGKGREARGKNSRPKTRCCMVFIAEGRLQKTVKEKGKEAERGDTMRRKGQPSGLS